MRARRRRSPRLASPLALALAAVVACPPAAAWIRTDFTIPGPYVIYKTEPEFRAIKTEVTHYTPDRSGVAPGYIFIAPHIDTLGWGPHIFDENGELVWYGAETVSQVEGHYCYAMNFHVCDFLGGDGDHICYSEARPHTKENNAGIKAVGANRFFNNHYEPATPDFQHIADFPEPNPHEFTVFKGGATFAQTVYTPRQLDLRPYAGSEYGWALEGCIQEIDIHSRTEIFRWCILDDQPIWNTDVFLRVEGNTVNKSTPIGGTGGEHFKWDFIHLNSIDKDEEGNYLISGRHFDQIVKVAGPNNTCGYPVGQTIWKLGGRASDFKIDEEAGFSRQHDVRVVKTTHNEQWISIFNNAYDGATEPTAEYSSMKVLRLNNETMRASLVNVYNHPKRRLAYAQGSSRILPNGNVFVGWGGIPEWSEFTPTGTLLSHSRALAETQDALENYRALKFSWVGRPKTLPKLLAFCRTCQMSNANYTDAQGNVDASGSPLVVYVSWNGATEVHSWRFYTSIVGKHGPWAPAGTYPRKGFETKIHLKSLAVSKLRFVPYVSVEALDAQGHVLASAYNATFVPRKRIVDTCDAEGCHTPERFVYAESFSQGALCLQSNWRYVPSVLVLGLVVLLIEASVYYLFQQYLQGAVRLGFGGGGRWAVHKPAVVRAFDPAAATKEI